MSTPTGTVKVPDAVKVWLLLVLVLLAAAALRVSTPIS